MEQQRGLKQLNKANQRQHLRHKKRYDFYRFMRKRERGHIKRIEKHLEVYGQNDKQAQKALERYRDLLRR